MGRASETDTGRLQVDVHEHFAVPSDLGVDEDQCLFGLSETFPGNANLWFCWSMITYSALWGIASFFAILFMCT